MNFRIIEGDTTDWELYESFKDLYFNNLELTLHDIQDKLNLTSSQLNKFRRHTTRYAYDQLQRKVTKETGYIKRNQWGMDKK